LVSLTLREEYRLRVFENRVLRTIFGPRRDEITGQLRKLHNKKLHNLHSSLNNMRPIGMKENVMGRICGMHGSEEKSVQSFGGKA
jgi:hypothetical protein